MFRRQIHDKLKRVTMKRTEWGKSGVRSNNGVTYLLNDPPITFTETSKPQLRVSIEFIREILYRVCPIQDVSKGVWLNFIVNFIIYYYYGDKKIPFKRKSAHAISFFPSYDLLDLHISYLISMKNNISLLY